MNIFLVLFSIISFLFGGIVFLVTNNVFFSIGIFIISFLYFIFLAFPRIKKSKNQSSRFHECYHFINTFIISLSIKKTLKSAFEDTLDSSSYELKNINEECIDMDYYEKLNYINKIFPFDIYSLFLNIILIWQEEGGDILKMSNQLINEVRNVENYLLSCERMAKKKYIEFSILWIITLSILVFLKFALKDFYNQLNNQIFFPIAVSCIFIFLLVSIHILLLVTTSCELKGWNNNETKLKKSH